MPRPFSVLVILLLFVFLGYLFAGKFLTPQWNWLKKTVQQAFQSENTIDEPAIFDGVINANLSGSLSAVIAQPDSENGLAVFIDRDTNSEHISHLTVTGSEKTTALIKTRLDGWPSSLEVDDHLVLFDNQSADRVDITIRLPDRTYKYLKQQKIEWPTNHPLDPPELADKSRNLQARLPGDFSHYLLNGPVAMLNAISCIDGLFTSLPSFQTDGNLAWVGCGTWEVDSQNSSRKLLSDCPKERRECGWHVVQNMPAIKLPAQEKTPIIEGEDIGETSETQTEPTQPDIEQMILDSDYAATFSHQAENDRGLIEVDSGRLFLSVSDGTASCILTATSTITGQPDLPDGAPPETELPNVALSSESVSSFCTGSFDSDGGYFELEGAVQTDTKAQTNELGEVLTSGMGPFHVVGQLINNRIKGTLFFSNKAIELIAYER